MLRPVHKLRHGRHHSIYLHSSPLQAPLVSCLGCKDNICLMSLLVLILAIRAIVPDIDLVHVLRSSPIVHGQLSTLPRRRHVYRNGIYPGQWPCWRSPRWSHHTSATESRLGCRTIFHSPLIPTVLPGRMVRRPACINGVKTAWTIQHGLIGQHRLGFPGFPLTVPLLRGLLVRAKCRTLVGLLTLDAAGVWVILCDSATWFEP